MAVLCKLAILKNLSNSKLLDNDRRKRFMITGDIKQEVKTKSVAAIFLSILIIAATQPFACFIHSESR